MDVYNECNGQIYGDGSEGVWINRKSLNLTSQDFIELENLPVGEYRVYKKLTVHVDSLAPQIDRFYDYIYDVSSLNNNNNFLELEDFQVEPDIIDCAIDCGRCIDFLGENGEITEDFLDCIENCGEDRCTVVKTMMLGDFQTGGVYVTTDVEDDKWGNSVFNPMFYIQNDIEVADLGLYTTNGVLIETIEQLELNWNDSWAHYFLPYHPNYCYYEDCMLANPYAEIVTNSASVRYSSMYFDELLLTTPYENLNEIVLEDFEYVLQESEVISSSDPIEINYLSGTSAVVDFSSLLNYFTLSPTLGNSNALLDFLMHFDPYFLENPALVMGFKAGLTFTPPGTPSQNFLEHVKFGVLCSNWHGTDVNLCADARLPQTNFGVLEADLTRRFWQSLVIAYTQEKKEFIRNYTFGLSDEFCDVELIDFMNGIDTDPSENIQSLGSAQLEQLMQNTYYDQTGNCPIVGDLEVLINFVFQNNLIGQQVPADLLPGYGAGFYRILSQLNPAFNTFLEYEMMASIGNGGNLGFVFYPSSGNQGEAYQLILNKTFQNFQWENVTDVIAIYTGATTTSAATFDLKVNYNYVDVSSGEETPIYEVLEGYLVSATNSQNIDLSLFFDCQQEEVLLYSPLAYVLQNTMDEMALDGLFSSINSFLIFTLNTTSDQVQSFNELAALMGLDLAVYELSTIAVFMNQLTFTFASGESIVLEVDLNSGTYLNMLTLFNFELQGTASNPAYMMDYLDGDNQNQLAEFSVALSSSDLSFVQGSYLVEGVSENTCTPMELELVSCGHGYQMYSNFMNTTFPSEPVLGLEDYCSMDYTAVIVAYISLYQSVSANGLAPDYVSLYDFKMMQGQYFVQAYLSEGLDNDFSAFVALAYPESTTCMSPPVDGLQQLNIEPLNPCEESNILAIELAEYLEMEMYLEYLDEKVSEFQQAFVKAVEATVENLDLRTKISDFQYTLYYYDQAGNLIKTVPPNGVQVLTTNADTDGNSYDFENADDYLYNYLEDTYNYQGGATVDNFAEGLAAAENSDWTPDHVLATKYQYNSLNAALSQYTPDGGVTTYFYDKAGRLVLSQNAKQQSNSTAASHLYAYTLYDNLGRIVEAGQVNSASMPPYSEGNFIELSVAAFTTWVMAGERTEITQTIYDEVVSSNQQENLRGRVSAIAYKEHQDNLGYSSSTSYSYDIHGNVKTLWQFAKADQEYILGNQVDYTYDLITGNVNEVAYQKGKVDQYFHRYFYDANNRLQEVETSTNGWHWVRQAKYFYYDHGPLARVELGENQVQGIDYAYTIHGWLKAINGLTTDGGLDALASFSPNLNANFAADAYAVELGYYEQIDHENIEGVARNYTAAYTSASPTASFSTLSDFGAASDFGASLFNGNIALKYSKLPTASANESVVLSQYRYDELNRLVGMKGAFPSNTANAIYGSTYSYDANGNIKALTRAYNGTTIDDFEYAYTNQNNQLSALKEQSSDLVYESHIVQDATNPADPHEYSYDELGNLVYDEEAEIETIEWNLQGKVKTITREAGSQQPDMEFRYDALGNRQVKIVKGKDNNGNLVVQNKWDYEYYVRDATGNILSNYEITHSSHPMGVSVKQWLKEQPIYGSDRLGVLYYPPKGMKLVKHNVYGINTDLIMLMLDDIESPSNLLTYQTGMINYELKDHLGNVMLTLKDNFKTSNSPSSQGYLVNSYQDYYPFGMELTGRKYNSEGHAYGFNGQEKVDEISGAGNHTTATFWEYDTRLGRRWNQDPKPNPSISNYATFAGNPIWYSDPLGDTIVVQGDKKFIAQTNENLEKIRATDLGSEMLSKLESSKSVYTITEAMNYRGTDYEPSTKGGDVGYDPTPWTKEFDGGAYNGLIGLSHELRHAYDDDVGNIKFNKDGTIDKHMQVSAEKNAVRFQNYITNAYDLGEPRNRYGSIRGIGSFGRGEKISNFKYDGSTVSFTKTKTTFYNDLTTKTTKNDVVRKVILNKSHTPWYYNY